MFNVDVDVDVDVDVCVDGGVDVEVEGDMVSTPMSKSMWTRIRMSI